MTFVSVNQERWTAIACALLGIAVAALLSPKNSYFLGNFAYFSVPQLGVIGAAMLVRPRAACLAGIALAGAIYLAAFGIWQATHVRPEAMTWLGYFFSLPGALLGALAAAVIGGRRLDFSGLKSLTLSALVVLAAVSVNQVAVCGTVIHCSGR